MRTARHCLTPIAAVAGGLLAGTVGTAKTLAWDLSAHLAYSADTGATFWLLARIL
jgi:hypothetical protein